MEIVVPTKNKKSEHVFYFDIDTPPGFCAEKYMFDFNYEVRPSGDAGRYSSQTEEGGYFDGDNYFYETPEEYLAPEASKRDAVMSFIRYALAGIPGTILTLADVVGGEMYTHLFPFIPKKFKLGKRQVTKHLTSKFFNHNTGNECQKLSLFISPRTKRFTEYPL